MAHPYQQAEPHQLWPRAMSSVAPGHVDPVVAAPRIGPSERVATLGSCFAQHIARHLQRSGCTYFVAEAAPAELSAERAQALQYGLFTARFGNVYTVRQALQLLQRALGRFEPQARAWQRRDGRWVDPFRPQVLPEGYASEAEVLAARDAHLPRVREMFERAEWLVFTLGLTEGWFDRRDGAVFPLAPGVAGGDYDPAEHGFENFDVASVTQDLHQLIDAVAALNPGCRWLLTVSPVPLMATAEPRHVWTSTTLSKAVLRVAADEATRRHPQVHYFPSYEVITSPAAGGSYYADDLRSVTERGVQHVMRLFSQHCLGEAGPAAGPAIELQRDGAADVVCDEETIARALRAGSAR
jgi:hypothetical protein